MSGLTSPDGGTGFWCERAWLSGEVADSVRVVAGPDGTVVSAAAGVGPEPDDTRLPGIVLPGLANVHSHAFHRALRGRTHTGRGTFWTWREQMYGAADRLDPDSYQRLATAVYAEMALAGVTSVGEFHYVHHGPGGVPYDEPNAMGEALRAAARAAGIRLTLLDACYLSGGPGEPLSTVQRRFADGDADRWAARLAALRPDAGTRIGAAIHSVRAVPPDQIPTIVTAARALPLHVHVSEQPAENAACAAAYGTTPTRLLHDRGALGPLTTAVHAIHLTDDDVSVLGATRTAVCRCPTTERDLADGIGPARPLGDAGSPLTLGTDQHALVDLFEEARALEMHERLGSLERVRFTPAELLTALTAAGQAALGWPEAGRIAVGAPCDLVAVRLDTPRTAGADPAQVVLAATGADVDTVVVAGRTVVSGQEHVLGDVGRLLAAAISAVIG